MTQRLTRAQRAAVGPGGGKPLTQPIPFTRAQDERIAQLKHDFGAKHVGTPRRVVGTDNMVVTLSNAVSRSQWLFDRDGNYLCRYSQTQLDIGGTDDNTT